MEKIKILKGIEKICIAGIISGAGLMLTGRAIEKDKLSTIGAGVLVTSLGTVVYTTNKRKELQYQEYLDEQEKEEQEKSYRYSKEQEKIIK